MPLALEFCINRYYIAGMSETSFKTPAELQSVLGARLRKLRLSRNIGQRVHSFRLAPRGIKEPFDLSPIPSNDVVGADVSAAFERFQADSGDFRKLPAPFIRYMRIVFGVEHHYFRCCDFPSMVPRIVEGPAPQLFPVRIRKAIRVPKRFADIFGVIRLRGLDFFGTIQNLPVHYGAIRNYPDNPWVEGRKDRGRTTKASADDEDFVWRQPVAPTECEFLDFFRQVVFGQIVFR